MGLVLNSYVPSLDLVSVPLIDLRMIMKMYAKIMSLQFDTWKKFAHEHGVHLMQGGYVDYCRGTWRLQGSLAVSRGIGDLHLKQWVIPVPETKIINIEAECEFLILASDGLWDKVQLLSGFIFCWNAKPFPFYLCSLE